MASPKQYACLHLSDQPEPDCLPVLNGSMGPSAVDVRQLLARHRLMTFDPGFRSTASCESGTTFIDGDNGILLRAMGFPSRMFTAVFAVSRTVGWVSHWLELKRDGHGIDRPRQLYTGPALRHLPE